MNAPQPPRIRRIKFGWLLFVLSTITVALPLLAFRDAEAAPSVKNHWPVRLRGKTTRYLSDRAHNLWLAGQICFPIVFVGTFAGVLYRARQQRGGYAAVDPSQFHHSAMNNFGNHPAFGDPWNRYRRASFGFWFSSLLFLPGTCCAAFVIHLLKLPMDGWISGIAVCWIGLVAVSGNLAAGSLCPWCGQPFFRNATRRNILARHCLNCGLPKWWIRY